MSNLRLPAKTPTQSVLTARLADRMQLLEICIVFRKFFENASLLRKNEVSVKCRPLGTRPVLLAGKV